MRHTLETRKHDYLHVEKAKQTGFYFVLYRFYTIFAYMRTYTESRNTLSYVPANTKKEYENRYTKSVKSLCDH